MKLFPNLNRHHLFTHTNLPFYPYRNVPFPRFPPPPSVKVLQNISFVLLGLQYPEQILGTIIMQFFLGGGGEAGGRRGGGGLKIRCIIVMYWGFTYLEGKFELSNAASRW